MKEKRTMILAHRGASKLAPENTMAAFQLAALQQADGLEIDITYTKDGEIVVIHDDTIDRTSNGTGTVSAMTLKQLRQHRFNKGFESAYPNERIPLLSQVLKLVLEKNLFLNIEVKVSAAALIGRKMLETTIDELQNSKMMDEPLELDDLGTAAAKMVVEYGLADKVIFSSFNHNAMVAIKQAYPQMKTGLLYMAGLYHGEQYAKSAYADALHPYWEGVFPQMVKEAHVAGIQVNPWTVDDPLVMAMMMKVGVDCIITNKPELAVQIRNRIMG